MAASAPATAELFYPAPLFGQRQQQQQEAVAVPLAKTEQEAAPTTEAVEVDAPASDTGSTPQHSGSNPGSLDDRLTPFPPYHEPEESIYEDSVDVVHVVMTGPNGLPDDSAERPPTPLSVSGRQTPPPPGLAAPAELVAATQPAEHTEPAGTLEKLLATVRQPLSPPYWMHSRGSDGADTIGDAVTAPSVRPSAGATPPPSINSAASTPRLTSQPTYRLGALSLPVFRPPWSPSWPGGGSRPSQPAGRPDDAALLHDHDSSASSANFITLQDNDALSEEGGDENEDGLRRRMCTGANDGSCNNSNGLITTPASRCWAQRVDVTGFVVVGGRGGGLVTGGGSSIGGGNTGSGMGAHSLGSFVVWTIRVQTLQGGAPLLVHKRYSEFDALRRRLVTSFPTSCAAMPPLPPKSVLNNFRPSFLEQRRLGLQYFLYCILLNPEFSGSPVLKEFLFS
ncbi:px domain containing protein [Grosmannia clavigera kw1407]|uniref:Endosomal/vacuolar adapter protein YPT35 n=1 Tax=Grosmannia clavigera (strain kw1407 / UAMH 11150) TaxID=655863 RepID=F0XS51_GROCL|nr:px domain containing protein [Grosmannia clavigera kw1407]EFW99575.1 px domain containing protein [Grosmannia clavigera kw1407]